MYKYTLHKAVAFMCAVHPFPRACSLSVHSKPKYKILLLPSNSTPDQIVARKSILKIMQNDGHVTGVVDMTVF